MSRFNISPQDIPEDMSWLCDIVGVNTFMQIIDMAGGEIIYIPKRQTIEMPLRKKAITAEYNGSNARQLARKYGISVRRVHGIVKEGKA